MVITMVILLMGFSKFLAKISSPANARNEILLFNCINRLHNEWYQPLNREGASAASDRAGEHYLSTARERAQRATERENVTGYKIL